MIDYREMILRRVQGPECINIFEAIERIRDIARSQLPLQPGDHFFVSVHDAGLTSRGLEKVIGYMARNGIPLTEDGMKVVMPRFHKSTKEESEFYYRELDEGKLNCVL